MQDKTFARPTLRDLLFTIFCYRWVALASFLLVLVAGMTLTVRTPKIYEAKTRVFVGADMRQLKLNQTDTSPRVTIEQLIATEAEISRSLKVIEAAIAASGHDSHGRTPKATVVMAGLQVLPVRNTSLFEFKLQYPDPDYAAHLVNQIVLAYLERRQEASQREEEAAQYVALLADINARIDSVETAMQDFQRTHDISRLDTQINSELSRKAMLDNSRIVIEQSILQMSQDAAVLGRLLQEFHPERIPADLAERNRQLRGWMDEYLAAQRERIHQESLLRKGTIELQRLESRISEFQEMLRTQVVLHYDLKQRELDAKRSELAMVQREIGAIEIRNRELADANSRSDNLNQQLSDLRSIRTVLVRQLEETRMRSAESGNVRVEQVDRAIPPQSPIKPNVPFNVLITLLMAIVAGFSLPLYLQVMSSALRHDYEVVRATDLQVLCNVREC
jgi:polysaccharide biosynthesis transport protein